MFFARGRKRVHFSPLPARRQLYLAPTCRMRSRGVLSEIQHFSSGALVRLLLNTGIFLYQGVAILLLQHDRFKFTNSAFMLRRRFIEKTNIFSEFEPIMLHEAIVRPPD